METWGECGWCGGEVGGEVEEMETRWVKGHDGGERVDDVISPPLQRIAPGAVSYRDQQRQLSEREGGAGEERMVSTEEE